MSSRRPSNPYETPIRPSPGGVYDHTRASGSIPVSPPRTQARAKPPVINPFTLMGSAFSGLDASRFDRGSLSYKLALQRQSEAASSSSGSSSYYSATDGSSSEDVDEEDYPPAGSSRLFNTVPVASSSTARHAHPPTRQGQPSTQALQTPHHEQYAQASHGQRPIHDPKPHRLPVLETPKKTATMNTGLLSPPPSNRKKSAQTSTIGSVPGQLSSSQLFSTTSMTTATHQGLPNTTTQSAPSASTSGNRGHPRTSSTLGFNPSQDPSFQPIAGPSTQRLIPNLNTQLPTPDSSPVQSSSSSANRIRGSGPPIPRPVFTSNVFTSPIIEATPPQSASASRARITNTVRSPATVQVPAQQPPNSQGPSRSNRATNPKSSSSQEPFKALEADHNPVISLEPGEALRNGHPTRTYVAQNGHVLKWFQAWDLERIVDEAVAREEMRLRGDKLLEDVVQGKMLNYYMGLGKTHVTVLAIRETIEQVEALHKRLHLGKFKPMPVLVLVEPATVHQWVRAFEALTKFSVVVYDSSKRRKGKWLPFPDADVVISTVGVTLEQLKRQHLRFDQRKEEYKRKNVRTPGDRYNPDEDDIYYLSTESPFFLRTFEFVVIDEYHNSISNPSTQRSRAMLTLKAYNWLLLSGTPAQNKLEDFNVPIALLQHPSKRLCFDEVDAAIRKANRSLPATKAKTPHSKLIVHYHPLTNLLISETMITRQAQSNVPGEEPLLELPALTNFVLRIKLDRRARAVYEYVVRQPNWPLVRLLRERQTSLHPRLVIRSILNDGVTATTQESDEVINREAEDVVMSDIVDEDDGPEDTLASEVVQGLNARQLDPVILDDGYIPSKFRYTLGILRKLRKDKEKTIIFSMFTSLLDILSKVLDSRKFRHVQYDGSMNREQRLLALKIIEEDPLCGVILVSMKAGGTGLNITSCNNVIILDPWWNPYAEEQAVSRVYRMGQTRPCKVFRIISPNTVEKRIEEVQERKRETIGAYQTLSANLTRAQDAARHR